MLEEAKESLRGIDINGLVSQGLDEGIQSIDTQVLKARAETDFKIGAKRGLKRKINQSLPGRVVKRAKTLPGKTVKRVRDIFD